MSHQIEIDAQQIKQQLEEFLRSKPEYTDYNFEGSNISALLDLLAYNTHLNNLYLNMAMNEMFLDTAQTIDAVRSHSKELNYLPRSKRSAKATVNLAIGVNDNASTVSVPKGTIFTTTANNQTYTFTTDQSIIVPVNNSVASANIDIYEGVYKSEFFTVNQANTSQRFIIQDSNIDTNSLMIKVQTSEADSSNATYTFASDLYGLTPTSNVFFLQCDNEGRYELIFGNGITGRSLTSGNIIEANYRISSGASVNGAKVFSVGPIGGYSNTNVTLTNANSFARGGSLAETIESIKFNAPRHYQTLQRAVTSEDYRNLIIANYPQIQALNVYGGETENPPRYGRVIVSADVVNADGMSDDLKEQIREFLSTKSPVTVEVEFIDPEFLEVEVVSNVKYNINLTTQSATDIQSKVISAIQTFNTNNLVDFDLKLRYSRLCSAIDSADASILGNDTTIRAIRTISPQLGQVGTFAIEYANQLLPDHAPPTNQTYDNYSPAIKSQVFKKNNVNCYLEDDSTGNIQVINFSNGQRNIVQNNVGTVNYEAGTVNIGNLTVDSYIGDGLKVYGRLVSTVMQATKNLILQISNEDIEVIVTQERE